VAEIPTTSTTLLRDLAHDSQHARWGEFVARYRPMMEAFMRERFPSLDADDVIQETLIELIRVFPVYHYSPKEKGHFHNYLTGILRHRAFRMIREEKRREKLAADGVGAFPLSAAESDDRAWRESLLEIALQQLLADSSIHERTRIVFARVAVNGEKPDVVAASFGIERNAVDQMKSRMMVRLKELVAALEKADGA
jgi:RNA polymerase sigma factor (sigma-70 family)